MKHEYSILLLYRDTVESRRSEKMSDTVDKWVTSIWESDSKVAQNMEASSKCSQHINFVATAA